MKNLFLIILTGILLTTFPRSIFAQAYSVSMQPELREIISKKDKTISLPFTVTNYGDPQVIMLKVYKLGTKDSSGTYTLEQREDNHPITFEIADSSIQLDSPFLMKSKNTFSFILSMQIPATAPEKDYYYSVVAESETQKGFGNNSSILVQGAVGSHIILTVSESGATDQKGSLVLFDILDKKTLPFTNNSVAFFDSYENITLLLTAANKGKNYTKVSGSITLLPYFYKGDSQDSKSYTMIPQYLLAGTQGTLKSSEDSGQEYSVLLPAPFMGIYRLNAVVSFGENAQVAYGDTVFVVFPFKVLSVFALSFIAIFVLGRYIQKKYKTRIK